MLGRFLEVSLPAPRTLESWQFYQSLGFASATVGEIWAHRYAVVTDGRITLGLHDAPLEGPTLSYVLPDLARHLGGLGHAGIRFDSQVLGDDAFNEARFATPAGQHARLVEARTFSPPEGARPSALGWFEEYAIRLPPRARARLLGAARLRDRRRGERAVAAPVADQRYARPRALPDARARGADARVQRRAPRSGARAPHRDRPGA